MSRFQFPSLIGGGIRGEFITAFLNNLERKTLEPLAESIEDRRSDKHGKLNGFVNYIRGAKIAGII